MPGRTLEEYFVSLGIKGQNVVLSNIDKVKKKANDLSKTKAFLDFGKSNIFKAMASGKSIAGMFGQVAKNQIYEKKLTPEEEKKKKEDEKNTRQFSNGAKQFGNATKNFANSAATFDPLTVVKSVTSSIGESLSGISILGNTLGNLPKGIAEVTNALVDMASGALQMAKQSAAAQYGIANRNETTTYYGGDKKEIGQSNLSNAQYSELIMQISGSYGKIQKPMQGILNELVKEKNTEALGRVASGNWQSTGTDKGWMLQQISNQTAGLPPSIAQAIQTSLLKSNKDLIQEKGSEKGAQGINAGFENEAENQTARMFELTSGNYSSFKEMNSNLNDMQLALVDIGVKFADTIVVATNALRSLPETIKKVNSAIDSVMKYGPDSIQSLIPRIGK